MAAEMPWGGPWGSGYGGLYGDNWNRYIPTTVGRLALTVPHTVAIASRQILTPGVIPAWQINLI